MCGFRGHADDISLPTGDIRNDLYLTLEKGDFERGGKSVQKNIEVTMYVLYADGEILKVRLARRSGMEAGPMLALVVLWTLETLSSGRPALRSPTCILLCLPLSSRKPDACSIMTTNMRAC